MSIKKADYVEIINSTLKLAGANAIDINNLSQICCILDGKKYRFYVRYRHFPKIESKLAHFEESAFQKLVNKTKPDEIACLAYLGRYESNGKDQIVFWGMEIEKILLLEKGASNLFTIGEKTKRHIVKQPITLADELELMKESIVFSKIVLPIVEERFDKEEILEPDFDDIEYSMDPNRDWSVEE